VGSFSFAVPRLVADRTNRAGSSRTGRRGWLHTTLRVLRVRHFWASQGYGLLRSD